MRTLYITITTFLLLTVYQPEIMAESSSTSLAARVTVLPAIKYETIYQEESIIITDEDILKGYIDVKRAIILKVKANSDSGLLLTFFAANTYFKEVTVFSTTGALKIVDGNNELYIPSHGTKAFTKDLSFRFYLSADTTPGSYDWPVSFMVSLAY